MSQEKISAKEQHILAAGKELFWKYGIKRVAVEEVCKHAKVSKVTFYKFFKNKKELAMAIIENIMDKAFAEYQNLIDKDCPFTEKVNSLLKMKMEGSQNISQELIMDIYKNPELGLMPYMEEQGKKSLEMTMNFLTKSQKQGHIRQDIKVDFILYFINQMLEMATDTNLMSKYDNPQDLIMEVTEFFFYGIGAKQQSK